MSYYLSIVLTVIANVLYHVFLKLVPDHVHPFFSLTVTYLVAAGATSLLYFFSPQKLPLLDHFRELNWASYALGLSIVGLETGFLLAYRSGWDISMAGLVSSTTVAVLLIPIGLVLFKESMSGINLLGILLCLAGLVLVNYKG